MKFEFQKFVFKVFGLKKFKFKKSELKVHVPSQTHFSRRALFATLTGFAAVLATPANFGRGSGVRAGRIEEISTEPGEWRTLPLPDGGSVVTLAPRTRICVQFTDFERAVTVLAGDAFFQIAKQVVRPFVITSDLGRARALQAARCAFSHEPSRTVITAVEGLITASRRDDTEEQEAVELSPGQQLVISPHTPLVSREVDLDTALAWVERKIVFTAETIEQAIQRMNRVNRRQLSLPNHPAVRDFRITGTFPLDDPEVLWSYINEQLHKRTPR